MLMCRAVPAATIEGMDTTPKTNRNTTAFFVQAGVTFAVSLCSMLVAIVTMPGEVWQRAFLGMGTIFLVSSAFTLAKCVRDQQERSEVYQRLDQARVDRILAEHDPFNTTASLG